MNRRIGVVLFALLLAAVPQFAQTTGALHGKIVDSSGAVVPNATLKIAGPDSRQRAVAADSFGEVNVTNLPPGDYTVTVNAPGFGASQTKYTVTAGNTATLDIRLAIATDAQQITVRAEGQRQLELDPANNASATVLKGNDLDVLSDDPGDMMTDLQALAGPAAGPNGGQIYVDGFGNGQIPPKESIREIRINANPFSAEYDRSGQGRIEIFTKPGTDKFHGSAQFVFADSIFNTRNPFAPDKPRTQSRQFNTNIGGSLSKKASFTLDANKRNADASTLINAQVLDGNLTPATLLENVLTPTKGLNFSPRVDLALNSNTTLTARYGRNQSTSENNGAGDFTLLSRAVNVENVNNIVQASLTRVFGTRLVSETRFQFSRARTDQRGNGDSPSINVLSSFNGGGANISHNYNVNDSYELHELLSYARGTHVVRFGARLRGTSLDSYSTSNYNGTYTFTSLDSYLTTLNGVAQGLPFSQIKAMGGGARQYSVVGGQSDTQVSQTDASPFIQDNWRLKPNLTVSLGLRYELQNNIRNRGAVAPRLGIAWGIGKTKGNAAPKTVLRMGWGAFYDRIAPNLTLQTLRQNGIAQQSFLITAPDFFPVAPPVAQLVASLLPQAIYKMDSNIRAPQMFQSAITLERQFPRGMTLATTYTNSHGDHQLRSRNINAPLPGSFTGPGTGLYPFGTSGQLLLYESSASYMQHQLILNFEARIHPKFTLFGFYATNRYHSNSDGAGGFPANNYDLSGEWGRASSDFRHASTIGGNIGLPFKFQISPNFNLNSSGPVNITTGTDLNGDTNFNDRPAFATVAADPSRGVIASRWGVFNIDPVHHPEYGSVIIPRNYGSGYGFFGVFLRLTRTWTFGEAAPAQKGAKPGPRRYTLQLSVVARNALNHVNAANPNANMSSPFFGRALQSVYGANANRRSEFALRFGW